MALKHVLFAFGIAFCTGIAALAVQALKGRAQRLEPLAIVVALGVSALAGFKEAAILWPVPENLVLSIPIDLHPAPQGHTGRVVSLPLVPRCEGRPRCRLREAVPLVARHAKCVLKASPQLLRKVSRTHEHGLDGGHVVRGPVRIEP